MRLLCFALLALALLLGALVVPSRGADAGNENLRMTYENLPAEKSERTPVPQYALACLMALCVLVVVCMPARKPQ